MAKIEQFKSREVREVPEEERKKLLEESADTFT